MLGYAGRAEDELNNSRLFGNESDNDPSTPAASFVSFRDRERVCHSQPCAPCHACNRLTLNYLNLAVEEHTSNLLGCERLATVFNVIWCTRRARKIFDLHAPLKFFLS